MPAIAYSRARRVLRPRPGGTARLRRYAIAAACLVVALAGFFVVNWAYQVYRKPGELLAPVSASGFKTPQATWRSYGSLFEYYSTADLSPEFLAALAQVEAEGNPIARTYWRWKWSLNPFEIYRPASSALGMFQITDGTFAAARKYCIRDHRVVQSCWFTSFYIRTLPSHAVEMTAAYLHQGVEDTLAARRIKKATLAQKQKLAAVIHLCGAAKGDAYARRGFQAGADKCGDHSLGGYLSRVEQMRRRFAELRRLQA